MKRLEIEYDENKNEDNIKAILSICETFDLNYKIVECGKKGRKEVDYPEGWEEYYQKYINKEMGYKEVMEELGLKKTTFYKLKENYQKK